MLRKNILQMGVVQISQYALPLITLPYLVKTLGASNYGLLAFSASLNIYCQLLIDYGFNLSASREVATNQKNVQFLSEMFTGVILIKLANFFILIPFVFLLTTIPGILTEAKDLIWISFFALFFRIGNLDWFLQGCGKFNVIVYVTLAQKIIYTVLVFLVIKEKEDLSAAAALLVVSNGVAAIAYITYCHVYQNVSFIQISFSTLRKLIYDGWSIFISTVSVSFYSNSVLFFVGIFYSSQAVANFSAAEKILQVFKGAYVPISKVVYPVCAKKFSFSIGEGDLFLRQLLKWIIPLMGLLSVVLFCSAEFIVSLIFGSELSAAHLYIKIMAALPFLVALSNIYGIQGLINVGGRKEFSTIIMISAGVGMLMCLTVLPLMGEILGPVIITAIEFGVLVFMYRAYIRAVRSTN